MLMFACLSVEKLDNLNSFLFVFVMFIICLVMTKFENKSNKLSFIFFIEIRLVVSLRSLGN